MRKKINKLWAMLLLVFIVVGGVFVTSEAANYPVLFFCSDEKFENLIISDTATVGDTVAIRMKWFAEFNNEGYEIAIRNSNGEVVATAKKTWRNTNSIIHITVNWDTNGYEAGVYTVEVTKKFYSLYRWNEAPRVDKLDITLKPKPHTHTVVTDSAEEATCTASGKTEGSHCSVCGEVITEQQEVPAKGHKLVKDKAITATCTKEGKTEGSHCSVCGTVIKAQKKTAKKGHSFGTWKVNKAATVFSTGVHSRECSGCGKTEKKTIKKLKPTMKLSSTKVTLKKGKSTTIKVSKLAKGDAVKSWKTSNKKIATVTSKGKITAKKKGKATITVLLKSGKSAKVAVTIK